MEHDILKKFPEEDLKNVHDPALKQVLINQNELIELIQAAGEQIRAAFLKRIGLENEC